MLPPGGWQAAADPLREYPANPKRLANPPARRPGIGRWSLVFLSMAAGLLCKPMLVTLPFVLLLLDYWPLRAVRWTSKSVMEARTASEAGGQMPRLRVGLQSADGPGGPSYSPTTVLRLLLEKLPLFALSIGAAMVTVVAQAKMGATKMIGDKVTLPLQLANVAIAYVKYLAMTFRPLDLAVFYPYNFHPRPPLVADATVILAGLTLLSLYLLRRAPTWPWDGFGTWALSCRSSGWSSRAARAGRPLQLYSVDRHLPGRGLGYGRLHAPGAFATWRDNRGIATCSISSANGRCVLRQSSLQHSRFWHSADGLLAQQRTAFSPRAGGHRRQPRIVREPGRHALAPRPVCRGRNGVPQGAGDGECRGVSANSGGTRPCVAGQDRIGQAIALLHGTISDHLERAKALNDLAHVFARSPPLHRGDPALAGGRYAGSAPGGTSKKSFLDLRHVS